MPGRDTNQTAVWIYAEDDPYSGWTFSACESESIGDEFEVPKYAVSSRKFGAGRSVLSGTTLSMSGVLSQWKFTNGAGLADDDPVDAVEALRHLAEQQRAVIVDSIWSPGLAWYVKSISADASGDNDGKAVSIEFSRVLEYSVKFTTATRRKKSGHKKGRKVEDIEAAKKLCKALHGTGLPDWVTGASTPCTKANLSNGYGFDF